MSLSRTRQDLEDTLREAYAHGLLSGDTFSHRLDDLLSSTLVDPVQLVGDLRFRRLPGRRERIAAAMGKALGRSFEPKTVAELPLLGLDWSGATSSLVLGRSSSCDVCMTNPEISRHHARLLFRDGRWIVVDLGSTNGTYVNGTRVVRSEVKVGDVLALAHRELQIDFC